jgi:RHS repeat-associated protein
LLHALGITETLLGSSTERVLYLAGRPVAIARGNVGALDLLYLTTDHLGTPIAACDDSGTLLWSGGFEPFGTDWLAGTAGGASENGVWLRFPGQWVDGSWDASSSGATAAYNLFRWYEAGSGRYSRADPLGYEGSFHPYAYAEAVPTRYLDPLGLQLVVVPPPFDDGEAPPAGCTATPFVFKEFRYEDRGLEESWKLVSAKPLRIPIAARPINPAGPFRSPGTGSGALYCRCGFLPTLSRVTDRFSVWTQRVKCECDEYERTRLRFEDTHRAPAPQMLPGLQPIRFKAGAVFGDGSCGCVPPRSRRL